MLRRDGRQILPWIVQQGSFAVPWRKVLVVELREELVLLAGRPDAIVSALCRRFGISHSRPYHPQTLGKNQRFHRTLKAKLLGGPPFDDLKRCQSRPRPFPETPSPIEYAPDHHVRRVQQQGWTSFKGTPFRISKAFAGYPVGIVPPETERHLRKPSYRNTQHQGPLSKNCHPSLRTPVNPVSSPYRGTGSR